MPCWSRASWQTAACCGLTSMRTSRCFKFASASRGNTWRTTRPPIASNRAIVARAQKRGEVDKAIQLLAARSISRGGEIEGAVVHAGRVSRSRSTSGPPGRGCSGFRQARLPRLSRGGPSPGGNLQQPVAPLARKTFARCFVGGVEHPARRMRAKSSRNTSRRIRTSSRQAAGVRSLLPRHFGHEDKRNIRRTSGSGTPPAQFVEHTRYEGGVQRDVAIMAAPATPARPGRPGNLCRSQVRKPSSRRRPEEIGFKRQATFRR